MYLRHLRVRSACCCDMVLSLHHLLIFFFSWGHSSSSNMKKRRKKRGRKDCEVGRFVTGGEQKNEEMNCDAKGSKKGFKNIKSETKGREILIREEEEKKDALNPQLQWKHMRKDGDMKIKGEECLWHKMHTAGRLALEGDTRLYPRQIEPKVSHLYLHLFLYFFPLTRRVSPAASPTPSQRCNFSSIKSV